MAYVLLAALVIALGWGLKSAMSIPHPDGLTVILSSTVVLTGALFWVVVTLHALDLLVAFKRDDRRYLSEFAAAMRPRLRELLVAAPVMLLGLLIAYRSVGTAGTAALAVLPEAFNRPFAVPVGIALIGLGISLWRRADAASAPEPVRPAAAPVVALQPDEIMATLEKLADLKAKGILTDEEFTAKKTELLKKLV